jgi:hypothetical protein
VIQADEAVKIIVQVHLQVVGDEVLDEDDDEVENNLKYKKEKYELKLSFLLSIFRHRSLTNFNCLQILQHYFFNRKKFFEKHLRKEFYYAFSNYF